MNTIAVEHLSLNELVVLLGDASAINRELARNKLIEIGDHNVTDALAAALLNPCPSIRLEAAKALREIRDPSTAVALAHALDDEESDIRWVAGEALIGLGMIGLQAVLSDLTKRAGSVAYCKSAHHVLNNLKHLSDLVRPVIKSLECSQPGVTAPPAAYLALIALTEPMPPA